jgi:hypothetical protein
MASHPRTRGREDERRLSIRTLVIASIASATAAVVTSQFWAGGTPYAAALTPVIVTLVSEMLHRPTEKIVERFTSEREAMLPEAGGAAPPPRAREDVPTRVPAEPGSGQVPGPTDRRPIEPDLEPVDTAPGPVRTYKQPAPRRRRIAAGVVLATGVLAFAIAAAAITVPELIAGQSIGKSDRKSTFFGGHPASKPKEQQTTPSQTQTQSTQEQPKDQQKKQQKKQSTTPAQGQDQQQTAPQQTTPTTGGQPSP